ncbi:MAG: PhoH family protein [Armatimonadia bacterium]
MGPGGRTPSLAVRRGRAETAYGLRAGPPLSPTDNGTGRQGWRQLTPSDDQHFASEVRCEVELAGDELRELLGQQDANLRLIEEGLGVRLQPSSGAIIICGEPRATDAAAQVLRGMQAVLQQGRGLSTSDVRYAVRAVQRESAADIKALLAEPVIITQRGNPIRAKTAGQARFVEAANRSSLVFCVGPAGTGKTYLAMALAIAAMKDKQVSRIVLTRPIIEAGERLGFLPGDIMEKVDPYLRPLYDALQDIMGADKLQRQRQRGTIEVVPLAYMRGRTVNDAFIVLDEAQNTTPSQMKMALTRLGLGSRMVVTGDLTQSDLPQDMESGLSHGLRVLHDIREIEICRLTEADIVRHDLVQRIVQAYDAAAAVT